MRAIDVFAVVLAAAAAQPQNPSARELLNAPRPLTTPEIATILSLSQDALTGKVFSLPWMGRNDSGLDILMGSRGQPRIIRSAGEIAGGIVGGVVNADGTTHETSTRWSGPYVTITEFTGRPGFAAVSPRRAESS